LCLAAIETPFAELVISRYARSFLLGRLISHCPELEDRDGLSIVDIRPNGRKSLKPSRTEPGYSLLLVHM
jgi:hypothetical protein